MATQLNTRYAKLLSETSIDLNPPRSAKIGGALVVGVLPADYLATLGYYPYRDSDPPPPAEGYHCEPRYSFEDGQIFQTWVDVADPPPPPRTFSKLKLKGAIASAGLLSAFKALLSNVEVVPGYTALEAFDDAVNVSEGHPKFSEAVSLAKSELGVTDEQVESILSASVAE